MSLLVENMTYDNAIRSIRELVLDTSPVQTLQIGGQDFSFSKTDTEVQIDQTTYALNQLPKLYDLVAELFTKNIKYLLTPDYVATEQVSGLLNVNITKTKDEPYETLFRRHYFSQQEIEQAMELAFPYFLSFWGVPRYTVDIYNDLNYFERKRLVLLTAYLLIDRRRMQMASVAELVQRNPSVGATIDLCGGGGADLKNKNVSITTRIGDVFTVTENADNEGTEFSGFTALWGDKYSYFSKLQLYLRGLYEKQFGDFSLRDNVMVNSTFYLEKGWEPSAWVDTINFSRTTWDWILPDNRI